MRQLTRNLNHSTKPLTRGLHMRAAAKLQQRQQQAPKPRLFPSSSLTRSFSVARPVFKGLQPDQEEPAPKESEDIHTLRDPTPISDEEYNEHAEKLLEEICAKIEEMQESRDDVDAEYSVCFSLSLHTITSILTNALSCPILTGRSPKHHFSPSWNLCPQQAATEQADLAQQPDNGPQEVRLGRQGR